MEQSPMPISLDFHNALPPHPLPLATLTTPTAHAQHAYGTRRRQNSVIRPSQRARENSAPSPLRAAPASPAAHPTTGMRRIRPLGNIAPGANSNAAAPAVVEDAEEKGWKKTGGWKATSVQVQNIEFPPKHVDLHADDASNKVFLAIGRAFMSVENRAMTVKDLAELSMRFGLVCQNVSAASQAITFFIRSHLHRCEIEQDFPLLLRHVLSGTPKDDALTPALYSRSGGNVHNKDKHKDAKDENGKDITERLTSFRRGTTVWYLSKAAGAPCPFARNGIALRDYAEVSGITGADSRRSHGHSSVRHEMELESYRGLKRKRELRRRIASGGVVRVDDDEVVEGRKPPKVKLTLRLRPCLTSVREKSEAEDSSSSDSSSDSDSDSDSEDESMSVDGASEVQSGNISREAIPPPEREHERDREATWSFPPYPIQRHISIPPYTPSEETYTSFQCSPLHATSSTRGWATLTRPKLQAACIEPPPSRPQPSRYYSRERSSSLSVGSPPPDSDMDDDDEDDDLLSPATQIKQEEPVTYAWRRHEMSKSLLSDDEFTIKKEPDLDDPFDDYDSKRSSQTITVVKLEEPELDFNNFDPFNMSFQGLEPDLSSPLGVDIKQEEDETDRLSWDQPVDITPLDESMRDLHLGQSRDTRVDLTWKDVELLGPDSVGLQDFDEGGWDSPNSSTECHVEDDEDAPHPDDLLSPNGSPMRLRSDSPDLDRLSPLSPALTFSSSNSPGLFNESVPNWSATSINSIGSPETELESTGPTSPPPYYGPESPAIVRDEGIDYEHVPNASSSTRSGEQSKPWTMPSSFSTSRSSGKSLQTVPTSLQIEKPSLADIHVSEVSTPWERGMISQQDVEEHLLPVITSYPVERRLETVATPSLFTNQDKCDVEEKTEPPLSPQEEEVFQSFCLDPELELDGNAVRAKPNVDPATPKASFSNVFMNVTRSTVTSGGAYQAKRSARLANKRMGNSAETVQEVPLESHQEEVTPDVAEEEPSLRLKDRNVVAKPLRRSKRVAIAAATEASHRVRDRLRKRS